MTKYRPITPGAVFSRLTVLRQVQHAPKKWACRCECGTETVVFDSSLKRGNTRSCGCLLYGVTPKLGDRYGELEVVERLPSQHCYYWRCRCSCGREVRLATNTLRRQVVCGALHGRVINSGRAAVAHPAHGSWRAMLRRCYDVRHRKYPIYGGRGITVCERWRGSFYDFLADMGEKPTAGHSIDRRDNDGNYEPANCRWATPAEQRANQGAPYSRIPRKRNPGRVPSAE